MRWAPPQRSRRRVLGCRRACPDGNGSKDPADLGYDRAPFGISGLGIDAQRAAIERFATVESLVVSAEFVEYESGKGADALERRPQLAAALAAAKARKCSVVVAKLDRLSREVAFVAGLMAQRVPFMVAAC
jgi:uncharacterized protein (DUF58 family)